MAFCCLDDSDSPFEIRARLAAFAADRADHSPKFARGERRFDRFSIEHVSDRQINTQCFQLILFRCRAHKSGHLFFPAGE